MAVPRTEALHLIAHTSLHKHSHRALSILNLAISGSETLTSPAWLFINPEFCQCSQMRLGQLFGNYL